MEGHKNQMKRFNIDDNKGSAKDELSFTTFT
jgi:hypothetical protein